MNNEHGITHSSLSNDVFFYTTGSVIEGEGKRVKKGEEVAEAGEGAGGNGDTGMTL